MARIPEAEVQRLKDEVAVQRLVEATGIELKRVGKDLAGRCPFHQDDAPSLIVTPAKNLWHCFGCQVGGGPIDWVMKLKGVSFRHAVELLKDESSLAAVAGEPVKRTTVRALPAPVTLDADDRALLLQAVQYYHQTLKESPEALAYLAQRGLTHPDLVDHFKLGFANRTLGLRLPESNRKSGGEIRERLQRVGVLRDSGHEHFNGSLVIPVLDEAGQVREVYGRKVGERLRSGTPMHLYLPVNASRGRGVFNVQALAAAKEVILCESLIDALTFWCAGFRNVTTAYGIEGFTPELLQAFKDHGTQRVLIAFDRDDAGERGAAKVAEQLMQAGIECYRIEFPKGMDANEYALKVQPAAKSLGILIRKALWLGKGKAPERAVQLPVPTPAEARPGPNTADQEETQEPHSSLAAVAPAEPLPAARVPEALPEPAAEVTHNEITLAFGEDNSARRWRVRGLAKNLTHEVMKVNVLVAAGEAFHVDSFDLYAARARSAFLAQAAGELRVSEDLLKADLGRVLLKLEALQDEAIRQALQPKAPALPTMTADEHMAALHLLNDKDLPARILSDFEAAGVVGEATNKLVGYLAAVSRKLDRPLAIVIQSSSAGLMDAVLSFVPEEERVQYSALRAASPRSRGQPAAKAKKPVRMRARENKKCV